MDIERFDCGKGKAQFCQGCYQMEKTDLGDYVRFEDYEKLLKERDEALAKLTAMENETPVLIVGAEDFNYDLMTLKKGSKLYEIPITHKVDSCACDLKVWYGSMPESNGNKNWTASLYRETGDKFDVMGGFIIARSEYPDRVRYDADCLRHLIGEIKERPCILDYDCEKCDAPESHSQQGADNP